MFAVVGHLQAAAAVGLGDGAAHGPGHLVGVHDDLAPEVARGPANRLNQGDLAPEEALLVGVEDGHQGDFGQVQPLAQEVHPHQHVELTQAQVAHDLNPLQGANVRVQVAHLEPCLQQVIGQVLSHLLGERRHQHPLAGLDTGADLVHEVIDLVLRGPHLHLRVNQARGPDDLLHHPVAVLQLPGARGGADAYHLRDVL